LETGNIVARKGKITLIDQEGKEQVFDSLSECGRVLNIYRKTIAKYVNKDEWLIANNNRYLVRK